MRTNLCFSVKTHLSRKYFLTILTIAHMFGMCSAPPEYKMLLKDYPDPKPSLALEGQALGELHKLRYWSSYNYSYIPPDKTFSRVQKAR